MVILQGTLLIRLQIQSQDSNVSKEGFLERSNLIFVHSHGVSSAIERHSRQTWDIRVAVKRRKNECEWTSCGYGFSIAASKMSLRTSTGQYAIGCGLMNSSAGAGGIFECSYA